jgi:hypothetical protein
VEITDAATVRALEAVAEVQKNVVKGNDDVAKLLGYKGGYSEMIATGVLGETLIRDGYLNTEVIDVNTLVAKKVGVTDG